jgi:hypothetical protein
VNFALFSEHAQGVELCVFDGPSGAEDAPRFCSQSPLPRKPNHDPRTAAQTRLPFDLGTGFGYARLPCDSIQCLLNAHAGNAILSIREWRSWMDTKWPTESDAGEAQQ